MKQSVFILLLMLLMVACTSRNGLNDANNRDHLMEDITMDHHRHHLTERGVLTMSMTICVASIRHRKMIWTITV